MVTVWKNRHWPSDACGAEFEEKKTSSRVLSIMDIKLAFVALGAGIAAAFTILVAESSINLFRSEMCNIKFRLKYIKRDQEKNT